MTETESFPSQTCHTPLSPQKEQELIESLKQRIANEESQIDFFYKRLTVAVKTKDRELENRYCRAITASKVHSNELEKQLSELNQRLRTLEENQRDMMRGKFSRSSSFSGTPRKPSDLLSDESSPRAESSGFLSTPGEASGCASGSHTPHDQTMTGAGLPRAREDPANFEHTEMIRYYRKLKSAKKTQRLSAYSIHYHPGPRLVAVARYSSNPNESISIVLRTATEVRNIYMLFALCERENILSQLIANNFDYCNILIK